MPLSEQKGKAEKRQTTGKEAANSRSSTLFEDHHSLAAGEKAGARWFMPYAL
jgi:hypothetical protein